MKYDSLIFDLNGTLETLSGVPLFKGQTEQKNLSLYPGVVEGLKTLSQYYPLFIVSNCPEGYIEAFLDRSSLSELIQDYESMGRTGQTKGQNILAVIQRNQLKNTVYIGDSKGDYFAATEAKIPFIHVDYGYGQVMGVPSFSSFELLVRHLLLV